MKSVFFALLLSLILPNPARAVGTRDWDPMVQTVEYKIMKNGSFRQTTEVVFKILNEEGLEKARRYRTSYQDSKQKLILIQAFIQNGIRDYPFNLQEMQAVQNAASSSSEDVKELAIPPGHLMVGSVVHLRYAINSKPLIGSLFSAQVKVSADLPSEKEFYQFVSEVPLHFKPENLPSYMDVSAQERGHEQVLVIRPISEARRSPLPAPHEGLIHVSTVRDWKEIQNAMSGFYSKAISRKLPPALSKIVQEAKTQSNAKAVIETAIRSLRQKIKYSDDESPEFAKMIPSLQEKNDLPPSAQSADFSVLATALLRNLGFEAYPFLTFESAFSSGPNFLKDLSGFPSFAGFNHVVVWAREPSGTIWWIDPANPHVQANVFKSELLGNFGLLVDGKSDRVQILPESNPEPARLELEQSLVLGKDNSVQASGALKMSSSVYDHFASLQNLKGVEGLQKAFLNFLEPHSQNGSLSFRENQTGDLGFQFQYKALKGIETEHASKSISLPNLLGPYAQDFLTDEDGDLGEEGTIKVVTHLKGKKEIDPIRAGCLLRSPWLDLDRRIENKADEVVVTDTIQNKSRFVSRTQLTPGLSYMLTETLANCISNGKIFFDPVANIVRPTLEKEQEQLKGPPFDTMTDQGAKDLLESSGTTQYSYIGLKVYRYFEKKLQKNPQDPEAHFYMAMALRRFGSANGLPLVMNYLDEAIGHFDVVIESGKTDLVAKAYLGKIRNLVLEKKIDKAYQAFNRLYQKYPRDINTFQAAYKIALFEKKYEDAEKWLRLTEPLSKTDSEKSDFNIEMAELFELQKRPKDALGYFEKFVAFHPTNPAALHKLAGLYERTENWAKVIEVERKVVNMQGSPVGARHLLASALVTKLEQQKQRSPASVQGTEEALLEVLKYEDSNLTALVELAQYYLQSYQKTKKSSELEKGKAMLMKAMRTDPTQPQVIEIQMAYRKENVGV